MIVFSKIIRIRFNNYFNNSLSLHKFLFKKKEIKINIRSFSMNNINKLTENEWRMKLTPEQFRVLRKKGTESPGTGIYNKHFENGIYNCAGCNNPLYKSVHKFDAGCGWPAFFDAIPGAIKQVPDSDGKRIEILCSQCNGHMGHIFKGEGFNNPTDERHCVNSISIQFVPEK